ncbi:DUF6520 family protein [Galbibacter orientalis]|uniref:DUF6520 family protein n=1 Tax=Galbibacter orientalis TaxID=453852 RepID=UPI003080D9A8
MKTKFLKSVLPISVVTLAIAGAFSTHAMDKASDRMVERTGYEHLSQQEPCVARIACTTDPGDPCTFNGAVLYDQLTSVSCPNPLNKIQQ